MDIFKTLRMEHVGIRHLVASLMEATESSDADSEHEWSENFYELKSTFLAHNRAEEAVFYDLLQTQAHRPDLADGKAEEHHVAEALIDELEFLTPQDTEWGLKLALLRNQIESHVAEEETSVFSLLEPLMTEEESERRAREFDRLRAEFIAQSHRNLQGSRDISTDMFDLLR